MTQNFKIVSETYHDSHGESMAPTYFIKQLKSFMGLYYWRYVKYTESSWSDSYRTRMKFDEVGKAEKFINTVLCPNIPREKTITKDVKTIGCINK